MLTSALGPDAVQSFAMLGGDFGTAQTIAHIRQLISRGKKNIEINRLAIQIAWHAPQFSQCAKAEAIFRWVQQNFRFMQMIVGAQTLRTPEEILRVRAGDCTNLNAILIPALLETIGIRTRLVTVAVDPEDPHEFTHVYAEAFCDGEWLPMDVARPDAQFGLAPAQHDVHRMRIWDTQSANYRDVPGLSGLLMARPKPRGLGQFDWSQFESEIPSIIGQTSGLVSASRAAPSNIYATVAGAAPGTPAAAVQPSIAGSTFSTIPSSYWLIGALLLSALLIARR